MRYSVLLFVVIFWMSVSAKSPSSYVDPLIGSEGVGRVYVGPTMPFGMIKPSPDGADMPNQGWSPIDTPIRGFAQTHVSGTGGGQKYGNVLMMPFVGGCSQPWAVTAMRNSEIVQLGYYAATLDESGIGVEITSAHKAAIYRLAYPADSQPGLIVDAGFFLGMSPIPDQREQQQFVGAQIEVVSDTQLRGYTRVRGGWNNGRAYTVYFYAEADKPFADVQTWKGETLSDAWWQSDTHKPVGAVIKWAEGTEQVQVKIAISFLGELRAQENLQKEIPHWNFGKVHDDAVAAWDDLLGRIEIDPATPERLKTMFYTGLYHTMIMPTDRSGENPLWADDDPYYDDLYAIWDTYRTSLPLITLIDRDREVSIVNSLLNIYRRDGYMPDARSGNSNGRTQGGSNGEIVIADAFVKGLDGIDYEYALEAMLKDADVPPGGNEEAEGRGGLREYNRLGYIPYGIPRAGNRTVEYSYCDYALAEVARGLGHDDIADRFMRQSHNWQNLWRADYEHDGAKGFIMPRDAQGAWLDSLTQGKSKLRQPKYEYTPVTFEGPWYVPWWDMFFYEANSWEYSLSMPHDVEALIEACGGAEAFERRLDTLFDKGYYNVGNEPSFLSPCLYHWIGKPHRSSERIHKIVSECFDATPLGIPGNDDSGAMSSWLAFHMMGLYPNAGQDYYLINSPMLKSSTLHLADGKDFTVTAKNFSDGNPYIVKATLNGKDYPYSSIRHADIAQGGVLELTMGSKPSGWGRDMAPAPPIRQWQKPEAEPLPPLPAIDPSRVPEKMKFTFKLHGQTRRYEMSFDEIGDTVVLNWGIQRNLQWHSGSMTMLPESVENGESLCLQMPVNGEHVTVPTDETAYIISRNRFAEMKQTGQLDYGNAHYRVLDAADGYIHVKDPVEGCEMWILDNPRLPIVWRMASNPLLVNWTVTPL